MNTLNNVFGFIKDHLWWPPRSSEIHSNETKKPSDHRQSSRLDHTGRSNNPDSLPSRKRKPPPAGYPSVNQSWSEPYHMQQQPPQNINLAASYPPTDFSFVDSQHVIFHSEGYMNDLHFESHHTTQTRAISPSAKRARIEGDFSRISDQYTTLGQVTEALARAGLESSNLIVGIDFTKSNEWTGKNSYGGRSLHDIGVTQNPYEQAISIVGETLSKFDEDNQIPCFGFGDATTHDQDVFGFYPGGRQCNGFKEVLSRYRQLVPHLKLAGPTSFAPIIEMAMTIVEKSGGQYHVLLIIADGQVTRSVDTGVRTLSPQEKMTVDAIVKASKFPLSIVLVGVGDGPWDMMKKFDDNIPARSFDNFQFVNFTEIMTKTMPQSKREAEFALAALMEIPSQYKATIAHGILGHCSVASSKRIPLPPPHISDVASSIGTTSQPRDLTEREPPSVTPPSTETINEPASADSPSTLNCPVCLVNRKNTAFGCGHQACNDCQRRLQMCPICRSPIEIRIKLY